MRRNPRVVKKVAALHAAKVAGQITQEERDRARMDADGVERKMDRPWFRAQNHNHTLGYILMENTGAERLAPLAEGERKLGWLVLPPFQRPAVWTLEQNTRLIESIWQGLPIGTWCYNRTENMLSPRDAWLLDGQQRLGAIRLYVAGAFPVMGFFYSELTDIDRRMFEMTPFACLETNIDDATRLEEVYDRLAYGGTAHEKKGS